MAEDGTINVSNKSRYNFRNNAIIEFEFGGAGETTRTRQHDITRQDTAPGNTFGQTYLESGGALRTWQVWRRHHRDTAWTLAVGGFVKNDSCRPIALALARVGMTRQQVQRVSPGGLFDLFERWVDGPGATLVSWGIIANHREIAAASGACACTACDARSLCLKVGLSLCP